MFSKNIALVIFRSVFLGLMFIICHVVQVKADVGPKPGMDFQFTYEKDKIPIVNGQLLECSDETCSDTQPLAEMGPQRFACTQYECHALAYAFGDYFKLVIEFEDRARESNVFTKKAFNASYIVTVNENSLDVKEKFKLGACCNMLGLWLTLVVEPLVASIYLSTFHLPGVFLGWVPLASLVTLPAVWFAFPLLPLPSIAIIGFSEIFAVLVETFLLHIFPFRRLSLKHALLLSLTMNLVSFLIGLFVSTPL